MEDIYYYINENNIINDEIYKAFKFSISCPICSNIIIEPLMCMKCQNSFCQKCINQWNLINEKCPNRCINPNYQMSKEMNGLLSKLNFKCEFCTKTFEYNKMKEHYYSDFENMEKNDKREFQQPEKKKKMIKIENKNAQLFESRNKINSKLFFIIHILLFL